MRGNHYSYNKYTCRSYILGWTFSWVVIGNFLQLFVAKDQQIKIVLAHGVFVRYRNDKNIEIYEESINCTNANARGFEINFA